MEGERGVEPAEGEWLLGGGCGQVDKDGMKAICPAKFFKKDKPPAKHFKDSRRR